MKSSLIMLFMLSFSVITIAQNVGIGQSSPVMKLHVTHNNLNVLQLENTTFLSTGVETNMYFKTGQYFTGAIKSIGTSTVASRLGIFTFASLAASDMGERLTILNDGKVGINNTSPAYTLDVNGNFNVSSLASLNTLRVNAGVPGVGKILTSDASGNATWQTPNQGITSIITVPFAAFHPEAEPEKFFYSTNNGGWTYFLGTAASSRNMMAPISLPDKAIVKKITAYIYDNSTIGNISVNLDEINDGGTSVGYGGVGGLSSSGNSTFLQKIEIAVNPFNFPVDNINKSYFIRASSSAWDGLNLKLGWVKIEYLQ